MKRMAPYAALFFLGVVTALGIALIRGDWRHKGEEAPASPAEGPPVALSASDSGVAFGQPISFRIEVSPHAGRLPPDARVELVATRSDGESTSLFAGMREDYSPDQVRLVGDTLLLEYTKLFLLPGEHTVQAVLRDEEDSELRSNTVDVHVLGIEEGALASVVRGVVLAATEDRCITRRSGPTVFFPGVRRLGRAFPDQTLAAIRDILAGPSEQPWEQRRKIGLIMVLGDLADRGVCEEWGYERAALRAEELVSLMSGVDDPEILYNYLMMAVMYAPEFAEDAESRAELLARTRELRHSANQRIAFAAYLNLATPELFPAAEVADLDLAREITESQVLDGTSSQQILGRRLTRNRKKETP